MKYHKLYLVALTLITAFLQFQILFLETTVTYQIEIDTPTTTAPVVDTIPTTTASYWTKERVKERVAEVFADAPIMVQVAKCESTFRHYLDEDGTVLTGRVDPRDTGVLQINKYYHEDSAERMGLNLDDIEDNIAYARHLYDTQGTQPWYPSEHCWSQHLAYQS